MNKEIETAGTRHAIAAQGTVMPQFGTEFLDRIMDLNDEGMDLQFSQNLTNQQVTLSNELSNIETEIMAALKTSSQEKDGTLDTFNEAQLSEVLKEIANKLIIYFDVSTRIYETVSVESLGMQSTMFRFMDAEVFNRTEGDILNMNNLKLFNIALFLTLVTVVPLTMIRQALKE